MAYTFKHGDRPVDGYTIQRAVGKGGFGEVYYAVSDGGREVAIKYLRDNPQIELRGVSNCINLKSPYLVAIFDVKKTVDDEYAIIMEYCSGPSLRDLLIAEPKGFAPEKAAFFVREIAKGLSYLHDRGIVHRDLKPGNIFYDDGYVKIGDYGLSKFISVSRHSAQTASVGTVHYMAPEIGSGNYSKGVDVYALGVMLYEMLLGKVPFEGFSMAEVLMKHLTAQPELDELPQPFGSVIRKALQKDPKDRYQTVDEMVEDVLGVAEVQKSLAGFSTKSLDGAVYRGSPDRAQSPIPSPNPPPFAQPVRGAHLRPPPPGPVGAGSRLPDKVARKMDRISRKMEAKLAKLGGRSRRPTPSHAEQPPPPPPPPTPRSGAAQEQLGPMAALLPGDRRKRMLLSGMLSVAFAVGLGVLVGSTTFEEAGLSAGFMVLAVAGGIVLSRGAINWFGVAYGPTWSQRMVRVCCCAPLLALGAAPLLETHRHSEAGAALMIGMLLITVLLNWEKTFERSATGEMRFSSAIGTAALALGITAALGGIFNARLMPEIIFIAAGVAGLASLIVQATAWWLPGRATRAWQQLGSGRYGEGAYGARGQVPPPPMPDQDMQQAHAPAPAVGMEGAQQVGTAALGKARSKLRWGTTRAFWGLTAFVLMGGAIVTLLVAAVVEDLRYENRTGVIFGCIACASFMVFALRKTTPVKRSGFWRESLRPFLLSASLFGIGATTTAIARYWDYAYSHGDHYHEMLSGDDRGGLVTGLVLCALLFLALSLFTGKKPKAPKPFLQGTGNQTADGKSPMECCEGALDCGADLQGPAPAEDKT